MATRYLAGGPNAMRSPSAGALREEDYRTFCAALESTQRGRDFLVEYARRNRNADTEMLLDALDRIETMMAAEGAARDRLRDELRVLLIAIRLARPDIDSATALTKAARLVDLLDLMEKRIDAMVEDKSLSPIKEEPLPAALFTPAALSVVPRPDEPELPIPSSVTIQPPPMALVQDVTIQKVPEPQRLEHALAKQEPPKQDNATPALAMPEPVSQALATPHQEATAVQEAAPPETALQEIAAQALAQQQALIDQQEALLKARRGLHADPYPLFADEEAPRAPEAKWLPDFGDDEAQIIHTQPVRTMAFMPEVVFTSAQATTAAPMSVETMVAAETARVTEPAAAPAAIAAGPQVEPVRAAVQRLRDHPLAAIMSLSEEERIALFT